MHIGLSVKGLSFITDEKIMEYHLQLLSTMYYVLKNIEVLEVSFSFN
jgi:hypothetical protein